MHYITTTNNNIFQFVFRWGGGSTRPRNYPRTPSDCVGRTRQYFYFFPFYFILFFYTALFSTAGASELTSSPIPPNFPQIVIYSLITRACRFCVNKNRVRRSRSSMNKNYPSCISVIV